MPVDNPARAREVADAIVMELNKAIGTHQEDDTLIDPARFTAARTYGVDYENVDLKTLRVDVRVPAWVLQSESHGGSEDLYGVEIAAQKAVDPTDRDGIDLLQDLTGRIGRYFCPKKILG